MRELAIILHQEILHSTTIHNKVLFTNIYNMNTEGYNYIITGFSYSYCFTVH